MTTEIKQTVTLPCTAQQVYNAWISSKQHGTMIEGSASIDPKVGGKFSIWDGDIEGITLELDPKTFTIVQSWRYNYSDWPKSEMSTLTVKFKPVTKTTCKVFLIHKDVPKKYAKDLAQGWKDYYWTPMKAYFSQN